MNKKLLSTVLIVSMVVNMTLPHMAVLANSIESEASQSRLAEQLKSDLGDDKASQIINVRKESKEVLLTTNDENINDDKSDLYENTDEVNNTFDENATTTSVDDDNNDNSFDENKVEPENEDDDETGYVEEPEDDVEPSDDKNDDNSSETPINDKSTDDESDNSDDKPTSEEVEKLSTESSNESINESDATVASSDTTDESETTTTSNHIEESIIQDNNDANSVTDEIDDEFFVATKSEVNIEEKSIQIGQKPIFVASESEFSKKLLGDMPGKEHTLPNNWFDGATISKTEVTKIIFQKGGSVPSGESFNIDTTTGLNGYVNGTEVIIYIGENDTLYAPEDCKFLFAFCDYTYQEPYGPASFVSDGALQYIENLNVLNTSRSKFFSFMFYYDKYLHNIDLSNFNTSNVSRMGYMFRNCETMTSIDVSSFNTSKVLYMHGMFENCKNISNLDLSNFDTSKVKLMDYMFEDCTNLETLDISSFVTTSIDYNEAGQHNHTGDMDRMFKNCSSLRTIYANENFQYNGNNIDYYTPFDGCTSLVGGNGTAYSEEHKTFEYAKIDSLSTPGYFTLKGSVPFVEPNGVYWYFDENDNTILHIAGRQPNSTMCVSIQYHATEFNFTSSEKHNIKKIVFDNHVRPNKCYFTEFDNLIEFVNIHYLITNQFTSMDRMFSGCVNLASLDLSSFDTRDVTNMSSMFKNCSSLTSLNLSSFNTSNVIYMYDMFRGCSSLTSLNLSSFNTSNVTNMSQIFDGCSNLTSLDLSNFNTGNVTNMSSMFRKCSSLTSLDLSSFNTSNVTSMDYIFGECSNLINLDLSGFDFSNLGSTSPFF